jgi:regulator of replication initiation timing
MCENCIEFEKTFQLLRDRIQQLQLSFSSAVTENMALRFEVQTLKDKLANSVPVVVEGKE